MNYVSQGIEPCNDVVVRTVECIFKQVVQRKLLALKFGGVMKFYNILKLKFIFYYRIMSHMVLHVVSTCTYAIVYNKLIQS